MHPRDHANTSAWLLASLNTVSTSGAELAVLYKRPSRAADPTRSTLYYLFRMGVNGYYRIAAVQSCAPVTNHTS